MPQGTTTSGDSLQDIPITGPVKPPPSNLRLFALAYVATLVVGGLALLAFFQFRGDDDIADPAPDAQSFVADTSVVGDGTTAVPEAPAELLIPLDVADVSFADGALASDASPGPGAPTLCGNSPATAGLVDWTGKVISAEPTTLYQVMSRFETPAQATAYLDAYVGTNSCDTWVVEGVAGTEDVTYTALRVQPTNLGDNNRVFEITGEHDSSIEVYAKVMLIQSESEVLGISLSTSSVDGLDELDGLATLASERLGYPTS